MLGFLQATLTLVTLIVTVPVAVRNLLKFLYLKFDDSAWAESHGKLLLEAVDPAVGDKAHVEMRRAIRHELERQQIAKWLASRVNYSIWVPYAATFVCIAGMIAFAAVGGEPVERKLALVGAVFCASGSILLTALCTRNFALNATLAAHIRRQVVRGEVRLRLERQQFRRNAFEVPSLSQRQLWRLFRSEWLKAKKQRAEVGGEIPN